MKNRRVLGVITIFFWAILIGYVSFLLWERYSQKSFSLLAILVPSIILLILLLWVVTMGLLLRKLVSRINAAALAYQEDHNGEVYLEELEKFCHTFGIKNMKLAGISGVSYLSLLKIQTLRELGRADESLLLIEALKSASTELEVYKRCQAEEDACRENNK